MAGSTQNQGPIPITYPETFPESLDTLIPMNEHLKPLNVLVFGPTGAGKSTIINHLTNGSAKLPVGHELESCTIDITPVSVEYKGRMITYLDTPGFDDSEKTPAEHLVLLMARLDEMYRLFKGRPHIHGIFYIHRITDNKMTKSAKKNIRVFQKLLGDYNLKNLVFVTNMWSVSPKDSHLRFENSLLRKDEYFGAAIKEGARAGAAYRVCEDAASVQVKETLLDVFLENSPGVLRIQQEMATSKAIEVSSTEAGKVIREELRTTELSLRKKLGNLEKQLEVALDAEEGAQEDILADITELKANLDNIKDQDSLLDADVEFLREAIPNVIAQTWATATAGATTVVVTEFVGTAAGALATVTGLMGGLAVGMGVMLLYVQWRDSRRRK